MQVKLNPRDVAKSIQIKASFDIKHTSSCHLLLSILLFWKVKDICHKLFGYTVRDFIFGYEKRDSEAKFILLQIPPSSISVTQYSVSTSIIQTLKHFLLIKMCRPSKCQKAQLPSKIKNWGQPKLERAHKWGARKLASCPGHATRPLSDTCCGQVACLYLMCKKWGSTRWLRRSVPVLTHYGFLFFGPIQWNNSRYKQFL